MNNTDAVDTWIAVVVAEHVTNDELGTMTLAEGIIRNRMLRHTPRLNSYDIAKALLALTKQRRALDEAQDGDRPRQETQYQAYRMELIELMGGESP